MKTFRAFVREDMGVHAMSVAVGSTCDGVTDHEGHGEDSISNHQNNTTKDAKEIFKNVMKSVSDHHDMHHPDRIKGIKIK